MKSIFKLFTCCYFIIFSSQVFAREVVLIENLASASEGELLKSILIKKFHLPRELITLRNTNYTCDSKSDAIIHLCLDANGELNIKKMNQYIVRNSLGVFLNQTEEAGAVE